MAIVRFADQKLFRNPWADFERMRRELDAIFQSSGAESAGRAGATVFPALNISEDSGHLYVRAEIPGVPASEVEISIEGDTLTIRGERNTCSTEEKHSYHRRELESGRFSRAITLPAKVQVDRIEAKAANGIVTIILPKAEAAMPRQIKVDIG
jgi:HSP20 family protein